jgi:hypothetical protein
MFTDVEFDTHEVNQERLVIVIQATFQEETK